MARQIRKRVLVISFGHYKANEQTFIRSFANYQLLFTDHWSLITDN